MGQQNPLGHFPRQSNSWRDSQRIAARILPLHPHKGQWQAFTDSPRAGGFRQGNQTARSEGTDSTNLPAFNNLERQGLELDEF